MNIKLIIVDCEEGLINNIPNHQDNIHHKLDNIIEYINNNSDIIDEVIYTLPEDKGALTDLFFKKIHNINFQPNINNIYIHNNESSILDSTNHLNQILHETTGRWNIYISGVSYNSNIKDLINDYLSIEGDISILKNCIIYYDKDDNRKLMREFDKSGVKILHTDLEN